MKLPWKLGYGKKPAPQSPPPNQRARYVLVVGFDFGTSFSKVVLQEQAQKVAQVVTHGDDQWLFPSIIGCHAGALEGPFLAPLRGPLPYLKMQIAGLFGAEAEGRRALPPTLDQLLGTSPFEPVRDLLAWYFTNVLSATRSFIKNKSKWRDFDFTGKNIKDKLIVQVCVPTGYMDDERARRCFHEALALAHVLSDQVPATMDGVKPIDEWRGTCEQVSPRIPDLCREAVFTFPEVAAGVQGVLRSPTAEDGLYLTIDIGAGTVDMNAFNRYTAQGVRGAEDRPNNLDYYAAKVAPYGVARIAGREGHNPFEQYPHIAWSGEADLALSPLEESDVMRRVASQFQQLFEAAKVFQPNLRSHGAQSGALGQTVARTWDRSRVYAWGGGFEYAPYRTTLTKALRDCIKEAEILRLPQPQGLSVPHSADYQRLSIAYGLSFLITNLEDIRLPKDLKPTPPPEPPRALPTSREDGNWWTSPAVEGENPVYD